MHIAFAVDRAYLAHTLTALDSILEHHSSSEITAWMLVDESVLISDRRFIHDYFGGRLVVNFLDAESKDVSTSFG